jgi:hypothetical protein
MAPFAEPDEGLDSPDLYPRTSDWLNELDRGPHGTDGHKFGIHAAALQSNMYIRISQLEKLAKADLLAMCTELLPGTADLILECARKECEKVRRREAKRCREVRLEAVRYA